MRVNQTSTDFFPSINHCAKALALLVVVCGAAGILYFLSPYDSGVYAPCPFNALTDLYCPGCGTLRGLHELLHGHIGKEALSLAERQHTVLQFDLVGFEGLSMDFPRHRRARSLRLPADSR